MIIGTVHSKSVGKTTLAVHLAAWLEIYGYDVAVIDADWQQQSSKWLEGAAPHIFTTALMDPHKIVEEAQRLHEDYHLVIVDGPAGLGETAGAVLSVSDAVIIPCGPGATELDALNMVAKWLREVQAIRRERTGEAKPGGIIVPVRTHPKRNTTKALISEAEQLGLILSPKHIPARESYARLAGMPGEQPKLLWQLGRSKDVKHAVMELDSLFQTMFPEASDHDPGIMARMMEQPVGRWRDMINAELKEEYELKGIAVNS